MDTVVVSRWSEIPQRPAVYVLYGGRGQSGFVAYVGDAGKLRDRLIQHFVVRDSSVVTGASATGLNIEHIRRIHWWEHERFIHADDLHAGELVAFDFFDPALRSRSRPRKTALA